MDEGTQRRAEVVWEVVRRVATEGGGLEVLVPMVIARVGNDVEPVARALELYRLEVAEDGPSPVAVRCVALLEGATGSGWFRDRSRPEARV